MAARLAPDNVRRMHQSLHHLVADAPWSDEGMLRQVRQQVLPVMQKDSPVVAWIVDDTGFPKQGKHSVGVARQYCGQIGKHNNCQAAVSLSVSTWNTSLPVAWRLYLPEAWCRDSEGRRKTGIPEKIEFQTKPAIALQQIRQAMEKTFRRESSSRMQPMETARNSAPASASSVCNTQWLSSRPQLFGSRESNPYRRHRESLAVARHPGACSATTTICLFQRSNWLSACRHRCGKTSAGVRAVKEPCAPALPPCVYVLPIAITSALSHTRKNGS